MLTSLKHSFLREIKPAANNAALIIFHDKVCSIISYVYTVINGVRPAKHSGNTPWIYNLTINIRDFHECDNSRPLVFLNFAVSISPEPSIAWYRDDMPVDENEKYQVAKENLGTCHLDVQKLEFADQVSTNVREN